jgi:predicted double-glycine peptidase
MFAGLIAALSLTASVSVEVPYVPQTADLCGGAAVAMVLRYWGDKHADPQQFAPLVDRRQRGIPTDVLVDAVRTRGWNTARGAATIASLQEQLEMHHPIVVLIADRRNRDHYVVVTGLRADAVVIHDPSWGPSRSMRLEEFERRWRSAHSWSLVISPSGSDPLKAGIRAASQREASVAEAKDDVTGTECDDLLDRAIVDIRNRGLAEADARLGRVRAECPTEAGPIRELAGVRFAERRWNDAAALAREALKLDAHDAYAIDVLGSSLFMLGDPEGALRAWNRIGKPQFDAVNLQGLHRSRYESIMDAIGMPPEGVLTADAFALARRRLSELPDRSGATMRLHPDADGFAAIDATIVEHETAPRDAIGWTAAGLRAAVDREATVSLPGFSGQGDLWSASWRWWPNRPRAAFEVAAPRPAGLPGIWRVGGSWDAETYANGGGAAVVTRQTHAHGGLDVGDWATPNLRYSLGTGLDVWDGTRKAASVSGALERRLFRDRLAMIVDAAKWMPLQGGTGFSAIGARATAHSTTPRHDWGYGAALGVQRVGDEAPLDLWPGAGDGHARAPLLRAHPLLDGGIIDTSTRSAFGRSLIYANLDAQHWFAQPSVLRLGLGAFIDAARSSRRISNGSVGLVDAGFGLRVKLPASDRILRVDLAHGLADRSMALTVGWLVK